MILRDWNTFEEVDPKGIQLSATFRQIQVKSEQAGRKGSPASATTKTLAFPSRGQFIKLNPLIKCDQSDPGSGHPDWESHRVVPG